jgi:hypothetical protein
LEVGAASFTRVLGGKTKSILYRPRNRRADGSTGHDSKDQEQTSGLTTVKVASLYAFDAGQRYDQWTLPPDVPSAQGIRCDLGVLEVQPSAVRKRDAHDA